MFVRFFLSSSIYIFLSQFLCLCVFIISEFSSFYLFSVLSIHFLSNTMTLQKHIYRRHLCRIYPVMCLQGWQITGDFQHVKDNMRFCLFRVCVKDILEKRNRISIIVSGRRSINCVTFRSLIYVILVYRFKQPLLVKVQ